VPLLQTADTVVEYLVTGRGEPVTVFAHGLAGAIDETRPFGSGVRGSRVFLHFRGHGASSSPETPWTYDAVAQELLAVADHVGATRALGVSLGAGALLRTLADQPRRFDRLVLVLPGAIDGPRGDAATRRLQLMAGHVEAGDVEAVAELLCAGQPAAARNRQEVQAWAGKQARRLVDTVDSGVARALRDLSEQSPLEDRAVLQAVQAPVLVIGQQGDDTHPARAAEELAAAFPRGRLAMFDDGGVVWAHRQELRELIGGFLDEDDRRRG
jgi:3-oxoadipate enol-lactonase